MINLIIGVQAPSQLELLQTLNEKPPAVVKVVEPTLEEKIKSNFYKCTMDTQYIRADNAQCLDKPQLHSVSQKASTTTLRGSGGYNDMTPGYCTWHVKNLRPDLPTGLGNANTWYTRASAKGLSVGTTPQVGAVATTTRGAEGHVSYVLQVSNGQILVSEMNVEGWNIASQAWYPSSDYLYIY